MCYAMVLGLHHRTQRNFSLHVRRIERKKKVEKVVSCENEMKASKIDGIRILEIETNTQIFEGLLFFSILNSKYNEFESKKYFE